MARSQGLAAKAQQPASVSDSVEGQTGLVVDHSPRLLLLAHGPSVRIPPYMERAGGRCVCHSLGTDSPGIGPCHGRWAKRRCSREATSGPVLTAWSGQGHETGKLDACKYMDTRWSRFLCFLAFGQGPMPISSLEIWPSGYLVAQPTSASLRHSPPRLARLQPNRCLAGGPGGEGDGCGSRCLDKTWTFRRPWLGSDCCIVHMYIHTGAAGAILEYRIRWKWRGVKNEARQPGMAHPPRGPCRLDDAMP